MFENLMKALARKGHQVDVVSPFPLKKPYPNYRNVVTIPVPRHFMNNMTYAEMNSMINTSPGHAIATILGNMVCESLGIEEFQKFFKSLPKDHPYDVVLIEVCCFFYISSESYSGRISIPSLISRRKLIYPNGMNV